jgi:hypothetical protein
MAFIWYKHNWVIYTRCTEDMPAFELKQKYLLLSLTLSVFYCPGEAGLASQFSGSLP